jgi:16S rRNA pseudouridine516 synthase
MLQEFYMRLDKFLAECNIGSRSQVKQYIKKGMVKINGVVAKSPDEKVEPGIDEISFNNKTIFYEKYRYFLLNKPAGYVSATRDNLHQTVIELLKGENTKDLFPVGRLDIDTEGLLLISNNGDLSHRLLSPTYHVPKTYYAEISGLVTQSEVDAFSQGVDIGEKELTRPALLEILDTCASSHDEAGQSKVNITITEGQFHQIKRMFQSVGMKVTYLKRIQMGPIKLDTSLPLGSYRRLTEEEIQLLYKAVNL